MGQPQALQNKEPALAPSSTGLHWSCCSKAGALQSRVERTAAGSWTLKAFSHLQVLLENALLCCAPSQQALLPSLLCTGGRVGMSIRLSAAVPCTSPRCQDTRDGSQHACDTDSKAWEAIHRQPAQPPLPVAWQPAPGFQDSLCQEILTSAARSEPQKYEYSASYCSGVSYSAARRQSQLTLFYKP